MSLTAVSAALYEKILGCFISPFGIKRNDFSFSLQEKRMEIFLLILIIVFLLVFYNSLNNKLEILSNEFSRLKKELIKQKQDNENFNYFETKKKENETPTIIPVSKPETIIIPVEKVIEQEPKIEKPEAVEIKIPEFVKEEIIVEKPTQSAFSESRNIPPIQPKQSFFEKHPDLEKFVGENLINKIGIAILVLGIGFFVKYAIDKDWIGEIGRTFIGILSGGILIAVAHRLRNSFKAFSSVLIGGGLSVLYFTIAISFHEYQLFNQTIAFLLMVLITGFSVILSISYDRKELAILAIIGGFVTPFLVSTGSGNYKVLFTYIVILNSGMLSLAYFKRWISIKYIAFGFTILLFFAWFLKEENPSKFWSILFLSIFYMQFLAMNLLYNLKNGTNILWKEIALILSNTSFYFFMGLAILNNTPYKGLFTALLSVLNCLIAFALLKRKSIDKNIVYFIIGLVITFVSLIAPIQLEGNNITIFWATEAVLILWFYYKSEINFAKYFAAIVLILSVLSLLLDWYNYYINWAFEQRMPFVNKAFLTSAFAVLSYFIISKILRTKSDVFPKFPNSQIVSKLQLLLMVFVYFSFLFEIYFQFNTRMIQTEIVNNLTFTYHLMFVFIIYHLTKNKNFEFFKEVLCGIMLLSIFSGILFYNKNVIELRNQILQLADLPKWYFFQHYLNIVLIFSLFPICYKLIETSEILKSLFKNHVHTVMMILLLVILSMEADHIIVYLGYSANNTIVYLLTQSHKICYPILWGLFSFTLMYFGMKNKVKILRIIALCIFALALLKLFIFDLRNISEGGKIASFILLGILLLIISFMYQKLKNIILSDKTETEKNEE